MKKNPLYITLFYCNNSIHQEELSNLSKDLNEVELKMINLPCSGKIDLLYLLKAIETGANGVVLITCMFGDCHYSEGNLRANKRASAINLVLKEAGIEHERIILIQPDEKNSIPEKIERFCDSLINIKQDKKVTE